MSTLLQYLLTHVNLYVDMRMTWWYVKKSFSFSKKHETWYSCLGPWTFSDMDQSQKFYLAAMVAILLLAITKLCILHHHCEKETRWMKHDPAASWCKCVFLLQGTETIAPDGCCRTCMYCFLSLWFLFIICSPMASHVILMPYDCS